MNPIASIFFILVSRGSLTLENDTKLRNFEQRKTRHNPY